jgi:serine/threonine protein kinase
LSADYRPLSISYWTNHRIKNDLIGLPIRSVVKVTDEPSTDADYCLEDLFYQTKYESLYLGTQKGMERKIVVKLFETHRFDHSELSKWRERFVTEVQVVSRLSHTNTIPIIEFACTQTGQFFYSMRKIDGTSWQEVIANQQSSLTENLQRLLTVCNVVALAHSKKIIHRGLQPDNVLVGNFGELWVTSWGAAVDLKRMKNFKPTAETPYPFQIYGPINYMSPEAATFDWKNISELSDIYHLGAILYQLLENKYVRYAETTRETLELARQNYIEPPQNESKLMAVALKAMSTCPADRYQTVVEFQSAVRQAYSSEVL